MKDWEWGLLIVAALLLFSGGPVTTPGPDESTIIVMLHESSLGNLPPHALGAARELTDTGYDVRTPDDDDLNGLNQIPRWLKPALGPGRAIMGPGQEDDALLKLRGDKVLLAIKLPESTEAILEAVK